MVGHIDNGRIRCRGLIQNINGIVVSKRIGDKCCDGSREIVVPVRRIHLELDMILTYFNHLVWLILPAGRSAVKAMSEIVLREVILKNQAGMEVNITNFGGRITSVLITDKNGVRRDVVLFCYGCFCISFPYW